MPYNESLADQYEADRSAVAWALAEVRGLAATASDVTETSPKPAVSYCIHCSAIVTGGPVFEQFGDLRFTRCSACSGRQRRDAAADHQYPRNPRSGRLLGPGTKAVELHRDLFRARLNGRVHDTISNHHEALYGFRPEYVRVSNYV